MDKIRNNYMRTEEKSGALRRLEINQTVYVSLDDRFILKVRNVVEEHIADSQFNVTKFAELMITSKSTLYKRMKALYNLSPSEYIQRIRLKHAKRMLKQNVGDVTAIAYAVGFNDPKYFAKCFKQYSGVRPSEILKKRGNIRL